ncbi:MAG TPA: type II toxin-antitoxin system VapC family toxin [Candidatus Polarisedimenticolaceae bacterium]|nr:type II toxin-antitoxin system VapC family toxin [Candidatus Polarisedimenticolaceae bacterium]
MNVALDTNRYVDLCKGVAATVQVVADADRVYLPFVVMAELRAGFALGRHSANNERVLRRFLMKRGVDVLFADEGTTHHYATTFRQLRLQGTPIPAHDLWIAALVLQHGLLLHSRDAHFHHLPQVLRI